MAKTWKDALGTVQPHCISNYLIQRFTNLARPFLPHRCCIFFFLSFFLFLLGILKDCSLLWTI